MWARTVKPQPTSSSDESNPEETSDLGSDGTVTDGSTIMSADSEPVSHVRTMTRSKTKLAVMRHHLSNGQRMLQKARWRISGSFLLLSLICSVCVIFEFSRQDTLEENGDLQGHDYVDQAVFGLLLYFFQMTCCCLAPMTDDVRLTRWALLQLAFLATLGAVLMVGPTLAIYIKLAHPGLRQGCILYGLPASQAACDMKLAQLVLRMGALCLLGFGNLVVLFFREVSHMQRAMWSIATIFLSVELVAIVLYSVSVAIYLQRLDPMSMRLIGMIPALLVTRWKAVRCRVQLLISGMAKYRNHRQAAAGIAGLVGNCSISEVMQQAKTRFRCVDFTKLDEAQLANNEPNPAAFSLSISTKLGHCDAFVSHSWHDDAPAKWEAMSWWRSRFQRERNRSPQIWLDKCCIDQNDIEADLRCLPIFLSGCSELVVFCGPTYLSRLWCIMELFTFVHIGGKVSEINVLPVLRRGHELEDRAAMRQSFLNFDVMNCECFNASDKEKMLDIIQMAFGELENFNDSVRSILHAIDWMRACPRDWRDPFAVPDDSPVPSMPSPVQLAVRSPPLPVPSPVQVLPEDSPVPSMPSPKEYQWLS